jgi:hypothetical protein
MATLSLSKVTMRKRMWAMQKEIKDMLNKA